MLSPTALRRAVAKAGTAVRAVLFVALTLTALTLAMPTSAFADFACDFTGDESYQQDMPGSNGESMFAAVNQWERDKKEQATTLTDTTGAVTGSVEMPKNAAKYTIYELNGMRGLNWSQTFKGRGDASQRNGGTLDGSGADDCSVMTYVNNGIANSIFDGTKIFTRAAISIKESASNPSPFAGLYTDRDNLVKALKENVLQPAVPVMIILVGMWVFTKWRSGDMREVWAGVSWSALTVIAVVAFLSGKTYNTVVSTADNYIAQANSYLTSTVLGGASGVMQSPCDLDDDYNEGLRISSCAMYDTLAFRPWALGQFGDPGKNCIFKKDGGRIEGGVCIPKDENTKCEYGTGARCEDLRVRQLVAQSLTNKDDVVKPIDKEMLRWVPIRREIAGGYDQGTKVDDKHIYPVAFDDWAGQNANNRIGLAFYSIIAALIVGLMVIVLSGLTLLWHAVTLILVILLPLVATIGIHPSQQKLLRSWLETFIHSFVLRAGFGVILTVLLVLYQMILPAKIALGTQLLLLLLVTIAVVMMLKKLLAGNFTPQVAGGEDALGIRDGANATFDKVAAVAPGLAGGAARTTGRVAGKAAKGTARIGAKTTAGGVKGTAWAADQLFFKGKYRNKMQQKGWLGQSQREQRKVAYAAAEPVLNRNTPEPQGEPNSPPPAEPAPSRGGRVSASQGQQTSQPTKQPESQAPAPRPRTPAPEPTPTPRPPAPPAPRDPRTPDGRV